ncbi:MAG: DEAD/DEAH box helicase family protein [Candidatus Bathyarchaeota archaeon]|nr:DEAD/DEAH box helicase family protein [Candidatus Bathyarchaeota archaeon]
MELEHDLGLNVLQRLFTKAFNELKCDELECMTYNVNLDLVLRLFEKYPFFSRIIIWSNTEKISFSPKNRLKIMELVDKKRILFSHISENETIVHSKIYNVKKNGETKFVAVGSPNLSDGCNQNYESLLYIYDKQICEQIWNSVPKIFESIEVIPKHSAPTELYQTEPSAIPIDPKLVETLWAHQKAILSWLINGRQSSIINIPPGTGKTEIAFAYLRHLFGIDKTLSAVILVPTTTLIRQWVERLKKVNIPGTEWGTSISSIGGYFANPYHKVLVTLYDRFFDQHVVFQKSLRIMKPNLLLILDECHNSYGHITDLRIFRNSIASSQSKCFVIGLSATIDSFKTLEVNDFLDFMGGSKNRFSISLQSFYSHWNKLNSSPVLKPIKYTPIKYCLNNAEMEKLNAFSKKIAIEMGRINLSGSSESTAAIQRARWLRGLAGGVDSLKDYISSNIDSFSQRSTVIFVQTNEIAVNIQKFITSLHGWDPDSSIYIYDSTQDDKYLNYAMQQFKKNSGFCLISEKMLSEGFDLPKIDQVILHGSDKSPRDWIQKIGRAIRFDPKDPESIADIIDVVFCQPDGNPITLENERYEVLRSISVS